MSACNVLRNRCALLVVLFIALPAFAADEPKATEPGKAAEKPGLQGYYAIMAKELKLSAEQKAKLETAVAERTAALAKWEAANGAKLKELGEAAKKADAAGDKAASKTVKAEAKTLRDARTAISDGPTNKLKEMLTAEQKDGFEGYNLYVGAMVKFSAAKLTKDQKDKARTLAFETAKSVTAGQSAKEVTKIKDDMAAKIAAEILTAEQRDAVAKADAEKKKPKPTTTAPGAAPAEPKPK